MGGLELEYWAPADEEEPGYSASNVAKPCRPFQPVTLD